MNTVEKYRVEMVVKKLFAVFFGFFVGLISPDFVSRAWGVSNWVVVIIIVGLTFVSASITLRIGKSEVGPSANFVVPLYENLKVANFFFAFLLLGSILVAIF